MAIRNAAKAIIVENGKILVNRNRNTLGDMCYGLQNGDIYYDLPGGGQNQYETLEQAVKRECLEETGYTIEVERLAVIYEEISLNEAFRSRYPNYAHKVYFVFICHPTDEPLHPIAEKDLDMDCSEWIDIPSMKDIPLYPQIINANLDTILKSTTPINLGSEFV